MVQRRLQRLSRRVQFIGVAAAVVGLVLVVAPGTSDANSRSPAVTTASVRLAAPMFPGTNCPAFPSDNVWNTSITTLPVNADGATWLASMSSATTFLHPDYGPSGNPHAPYGIPWTVVRKSTAFTRVTFQYASESNRRPYPLTASTPIEAGSDRHALMVDPYRSASAVPCTLFETYDTYYHASGRSTAGSGATWNLRSNSLRPAGFTSADAAGLPMGARFRLNASFTLPASQCSVFCQTVLTTMKTYGLILADNGSNWYFQGAADARWTYTEVDQLKAIPANQFVAVDESCLMVSPNSGQALQPTSAAYQTKCGSPTGSSGN